MRHVLTCVVVAASALGGCANTALRGAAESRVQAKQIFGDVERLQYGKTAQLQLPARVAVFLQAHEPEWAPLLVDGLEKDPGTWSSVDSLQLFDGGDRYAAPT